MGTRICGKIIGEKRGRSWACSTLALGILGSALPAQAQSVEAGDEIVVTATKRADTVLNVPQSIQAIDGRELERLSATSFQDIVNKLSGVSGFTSGTGTTSFNIRGIQSIAQSPIDASTVGYYLDEVPLSSADITPDVVLSDLERVEVLKGPQGTLYGEGSLGGTVKLITNRPVLDRFDGNLTLDGALNTDGKPSYRGSGVLNVPIADGKAALRIAGSYQRQGGFVDDTLAGVKDVDGSRTTSVRAAFRAKPTEALDIQLAYIHQLGRGGSDAIEGPGLKRALLQAFPQFFRDRLDLGSLTVNWSLPDVDVVGVASYYDRVRRQVRDERDSLAALEEFLETPLPGGLREDTTSPERTWTQELRLVSNTDSRFAWLVGGYHKIRKVRFDSTSVSDDVEALLPGLGQVFSLAVGTRFSELAAFGEISYKLTDALKITGGARIFRQTNRGSSALSIITPDDTNTPVILDTGVQPISQRTSKTLFKASVDYKPSADTTLYALFSQGIRGGGVNTRLFSPAIPRTYGPDSVDNYELGFKGRLFNDVLTVNLSAYQLNWRDIQLPIVEGEGISYTTNLGRARTRGIELEAIVRPSKAVSLGGNFGITDAKIRNAIALTPAGSGDALTIPGGSRLPRVARIKGNVFAEGRFEIGNDLNAFLRGDVEYVGKRANALQTTIDGSLTEAALQLRPYALVDLRAGIESERFGLTVYFENLFDKRAQFGTDAPLTEGFLINRPRSIGATARVSF